MILTDCCPLWVMNVGLLSGWSENRGETAAVVVVVVVGSLLVVLSPCNRGSLFISKSVQALDVN